MSKPWAQEALWIRRNDEGAIIGVQEKLPDGADFIPTIPAKSETKQEK